MKVRCEYCGGAERVGMAAYPGDWTCGPCMWALADGSRHPAEWNRAIAQENARVWPEGSWQRECLEQVCLERERING